MKLFLRFKLWLIGLLIPSIHKDIDFLELNYDRGKSGPLIILSDKGAGQIEDWEGKFYHSYYKTIGKTKLTHYDTTEIYRAEENET